MCDCMSGLCYASGCVVAVGLLIGSGFDTGFVVVLLIVYALWVDSSCMYHVDIVAALLLACSACFA